MDGQMDDRQMIFQGLIQGGWMEWLATHHESHSLVKILLPD